MPMALRTCTVDGWHAITPSIVQVAWIGVPGEQEHCVWELISLVRCRVGESCRYDAHRKPSPESVEVAVRLERTAFRRNAG